MRRLIPPTLACLVLLLLGCHSAPALLAQQQHELDGQLILAAYAADLPEVKRLLAAGADPNARAGERAEIWFGETHDGH